jgi:hypothetical protein
MGFFFQKHLMFCDGNADDILNSAISEDEIRIAIKDLKNNKASGTGVSKFFL